MRSRLFRDLSARRRALSKNYPSNLDFPRHTFSAGYRGSLCGSDGSDLPAADTTLFHAAFSPIIFGLPLLVMRTDRLRSVAFLLCWISTLIAWMSDLVLLINPSIGGNSGDADP